MELLVLTNVALSLCLLPVVLPAPFTDDSSARTAVAVFPSRVDHQGKHASFNVLSKLPNSGMSESVTDQYDTPGPIDDKHYFRLEAFGRSYLLNVSNSAPFVSTDHVVEYHRNGDVRRVEASSASCHLTGTAHAVLDGDSHLPEEGWVAISNCRGLHGVIATTSGYLYIEPVGAVPEDPHTHPHQHRVYWQPLELWDNAGCAYDKTISSSGDDRGSPHMSSLDDDTIVNRVRRSLTSSSTSTEHYVEVAVVADHTMVDYHATEYLEEYLFTLMNMVSHLYRDPSIGHAMNIVLVRTIILETDQTGLSITSNALHSLNSFCQWQSSNLSNNAGQDLTVLVTRTNICEGFGGTCGTLGIAEFRGACVSHKSCSISEDIGLATAFTIAHEMGHNLGIRHDGDMSVACEPDDHYIMSPSFVQSHNPHHWSHCSQQQLAEFLQSPQSWCLSNQPPLQGNSTKPNSSSPVPLPGLEFTPTEQCQLMLGERASHCPNMTDFCNRLWCRENDQSDCKHQHIPPAPGTECTLTSGKQGVCYQGSCVHYGSLSRPVDGGWGVWGGWGECSLSCGTGVQRSSRACDSPVPANGGHYCLGASRRYQTCNTDSCPDSSDIRQELCEREPPHSAYTDWQAPSLEYISRRGLNQCSHQCLAKPHDVLFTVTLSLPDGTPCLFSPLPSSSHSLESHTVPESLGVCVSGECVPVGCDKSLNHMASRDGCGLWCGNGSTCVSVSDAYTIPDSRNKSDDYFYHKAVTIPCGSGQVKISEFHPMENLYLAATTTTENFNGNYRVEEGGLRSYWFAGTKWWYERPNGGIECLRTAGVLSEDVIIYVIANTQNLSIQYSAGVPPQNATTFTASHVWREREWGRCEGDCGEGVRRRVVECVLSDSGAVVDNSYCETENGPHTEEECYTEVGCLYEWRVKPWSDCSAACGVGERSREIECTLTNNNTAVNSHYCETETIPSVRTQCYSERGCIFEWQTAEWRSCSSACGVGQRRRDVSCVLTNNDTVANPGRCNLADIPESAAHCYSESGCVFEWQVPEWSDCSSDCGEGYREREVSCVLNSNGTVISETHCADQTTPAGRSHCYNEDGCRFKWNVTEWSICTAECGSGSRTREVSCLLMNNATTVENSFCSSASKPRTDAHCYSEDGCLYVWQSTVWGKCSSACGAGERQRDVSCVLTNNHTVVDKHYCETESEPDSRSQCYTEDGCTYEWRHGTWTSCSMDCGQGTRLREVACYLTSNDTRVGNHHCRGNTAPEEITQCYSESGCVFRWGSEPWRGCTATCGRGHKMRGVSCLLTNNGTVVDDHYCSPDSRPANRTSCYAESGCLFEWRTGSWTACDTVCGEGHKTRGVSCLLTNNGTVVDELYCSPDSRPTNRTSCYKESGCLFEWRTSSWTACDTVCGEGHKTRGVSCLLTNNGTAVDELYCSPDSRPANRTSCYKESGCLFDWRTSSWTACDTVCGEGHKTRGVSCLLTNNGTAVDELYCSPDSRPTNRTSCYKESGCLFDWRTSSWTACDTVCGEGHKTRGVSCLLTNNGTTVDELYCSPDSRPANRTSCYKESGCLFEWQTSSWTACDTVCGEGHKTRGVSCLLTNNGTTVHRAYCDSDSEPQGVESCGEECLFEWRVGEWGVCVGGSCEEGRKWREVDCLLLNNLSVVDDRRCSLSRRPSDSLSCQAQKCRYHWVAGEWGRCDVGCGEGVREREVYCELENGRWGKRRVEVGRCDSSDMPQEREACSAGPCLNFEWNAGEWTQCDAKCDKTGSQIRTVTCRHENGTLVPDSPYCTWNEKPALTKSCHGEPCAEPTCVDNPRTSCGLVVKYRLCHIRHFLNLCCHSCSSV